MLKVKFRESLVLPAGERHLERYCSSLQARYSSYIPIYWLVNPVSFTIANRRSSYSWAYTNYPSLLFVCLFFHTWSCLPRAIALLCTNVSSPWCILTPCVSVYTCVSVSIPASVIRKRSKVNCYEWVYRIVISSKQARGVWLFFILKRCSVHSIIIGDPHQSFIFYLPIQHEVR